MISTHNHPDMGGPLGRRRSRSSDATAAHPGKQLPRVQALSPRFATQVCRIPTGWVGLTLYGGIAVGMWGARLSR
jgi:hypothetical protein